MPNMSIKARRFPQLPDISQGTVLWWHGQDDAYSSTIRDRAGNKNGTLTGPTWVKTPNGLWTLSFDGSDDLVTSTSATLKESRSTLTLSLWVKLDSLLNTVWFAGNDIDSGVSVGGFDLHYNSVNRVDASLWRTSTGTNLATTGVATLSADTWYHVAMTFSGTQVLTYINGAQDAASAVIAADSSGTATPDFILGALPNATGFFKLAGDLALVKLESSALSAGAIKAEYNTERHLFGV